MRNCVWLIGMLVLAVGPVQGQDDGNDEVLAPAKFEALDQLPASVFVAEALLGEIVAEGMPHLPPSPARIELVVQSGSEGEDLLATVATSRLFDEGYEVFDTTAADPEAAEIPVCDARLEISLGDLSLVYPESGYRLGIWRQWVARDMNAAAFVTVTDLPDGQIRFRERVVRSYRDRVPSDRLAGTESAEFAFTQAEVQKIGWHGRLEQIVVLGALSGLVAVYFANAE